MAHFIDMGFAPAHDLIYGFYPENVAKRLGVSNWRKKAVLREDDKGLLYVYVLKGKYTADGVKFIRYYVKAYRITDGGRKDQGYDRDFETVEEAIRYANGEVESPLSSESKPVAPGRKLDPVPAPVIFTLGGVGFPVRFGGAKRPGNDENP
jgi:hypothetical protein